RYEFRAEARGVPFQGFMAPAWYDLVQEKKGLFGKTVTRQVDRRETLSPQAREQALRDLAARHSSIPQDAFTFEARKHKDWLRLTL
ncbi:MAG: hypothetical protein AAFY10_15015, partial [Pseudomonadota bacterium]